VLKELTIKGFKSIEEECLTFPPITILFGPNATGKSNILDAILALSRIGTCRTLSDALSDPIRGYPIEAFHFPNEGLPALLNQKSASFSMESLLSISKEEYQYRIEIDIQPDSGILTVKDEYLSALKKSGGQKGNPSIEKVDDQLRIRRKSKPANPRKEIIGLGYSQLSDPRFSGVEYRAIERCRNELSVWRTYYLDPRVAMRSAKTPSDVRDIGVLGENIAPFLYHLKSEYNKHYESVKKTLQSIIPNIENLTVDLDKRRGTLDIMIRQGGRDFSSRIISEGTLRALALCAISVNPWSGSILAFEEPENGVHPRRIQLIVNLLKSLALDGKKQIIVTTHSPIVCDESLKWAEKYPDDVGLFNVVSGASGTHVKKFSTTGPLFQDTEVKKALTNNGEDGIFENLMLRGLLDE
jgi:predicted ATPase